MRTIDAATLAELRDRLRRDEPVRHERPGLRLHMDRPLPFLCINRKPASGEDPGTEHLLLGGSSYLIASGEERRQTELARIVQEIAASLSERFGSFLVIEVWAAQPRRRQRYNHALRIVASKDAPATTLAAMAKALRAIALPQGRIELEVVRGGRASPPHLPPVMTTAQASRHSCLLIGLEVPPIFRDPDTGSVFPLLLRLLRRELARAIQRTVFAFTQVQTTHRVEHYLALGPRTITTASLEADRRLAEIAESFSFLLDVTPVNADQAFEQFIHDRMQRPPVFHYRLLTMDPELLKRRLYNIRFERIEDPALAELCRQKRVELDRQITMLEDRDTPRFLPGSMQLFGGVHDQLLLVAENVLARPPVDGAASAERVDATHFAERARTELEHYGQQHDSLPATVELREDVPGIMVSHGTLLINQRLRIAADRVEPLIQHEVGTHLLTYLNGRAQPLQQLHSGLPGYDELQEGLAVLAEYLCGGLSRQRLRLLAARVIAVRRLVEGASFIDLFRELHNTRGFTRRMAFTIAMRIFRSGGFTKDAIYLRGLVRLLELLRKQGDRHSCLSKLESLLIGKISFDSIPVIEELRWRGVIRPPRLRPRYLEDPAAIERLDRLRTGGSPLEDDQKDETTDAHR